MQNPSNHSKTLALVFFVPAMLVSLAAPVLACINTYGTNLEGKRREVGMRHVHFENPFAVKARWREKLKEIEKAIGPNSTFEEKNDYAAALIYTGDLKKAIGILEEIERGNPGVYSTATNLGTAYELSGDNEKALEWIKKGIDRNPNSHGGSEWVHVKILEAKIALAKDPQWLKSNSVLGFNFGSEVQPKFAAPVKGYPQQTYRSEEALHHIQQQLYERLQFVSAPDPIVAELLVDLADVCALHGTLEMAVPLYDRALEFKTHRATLIKQRRDALEQTMLAAQRTAFITDNKEAWIAVGLIVFLIVAFVAQRKFRRA